MTGKHVHSVSRCLLPLPLRAVCCVWRRQVFEGDSPEPLYVSPVSSEGGVDSLVYGFAKEPAERFDSFFSDSITETLFVEEHRRQGFDLPAINIQRGRDHGIAGARARRGGGVMSSLFATNVFIVLIE